MCLPDGLDENFDLLETLFREFLNNILGKYSVDYDYY